MNKKPATIVEIFAIIGILLIIVLLPFISVWVINTCFNTSFSINTFQQWFAWILLGVLVRGYKRTAVKEK